MSRNLALTNINGGLSNYLEEIKKFPMLTWEEEYNLAKRWVEKRNTAKKASTRNKITFEEAYI